MTEEKGSSPSNFDLLNNTFNLKYHQIFMSYRSVKSQDSVININQWKLY